MARPATRRSLEMTTVFAFAILAAVLISLPGLAFAQMPGERKSPHSYDGTGDMKYRFPIRGAGRQGP
jgi:hypothetical protein